MQGGKSASALESAKEAAANVGASAWAGKEKTKAVVQETVAKARAHDPEEKAAADARKQERVREVEAVKQDAMRSNAAAKERATAAVHQPTLPAPVDREVPPPQTPTDGGAGGLVGANGAPATGGHVTDAAPTATETGAAATGGHAAGAPETTGAAARPDGDVVNP
ncbi:hypothetical protein EJB05_51131, partial [Eragrostis curvula]